MNAPRSLILLATALSSASLLVGITILMHNHHKKEAEQHSVTVLVIDAQESCDDPAREPPPFAYYGDADGYHGTYIRGSINGLDPNMGDFLCGVYMECGCPTEKEGGHGIGPHACWSSIGKKTWSMCNPFPSSAKWCQKEQRK